MENKIEKNLFSGAVYLALLSGVLIAACIHQLELTDALVRAGYGAAVGTVYLMVLYYGEHPAFYEIEDKILYFLLLILSVCLIGVSSGYSTGAFWLLPLVTVARYSAAVIRIATYGVIMLLYFCISLSIHGQLMQMEYYLIIGLALLLIFSMLKQKQELPYAGVILVALSAALQVLGCGFDPDKLMEQRYQILLEISSMIFLILFGAILFLRAEYRKESSASAQMEAKLTGLLQDDFVLMRRLREKEDLYEHSCEISRLSGLTAREMGFNSLLAGAGGMYHEIGRLESGEHYMEEGMRLAEEYHFPERMIEIMRQHSTKSELPTSPEAAIVMLSDYIVSTGEYLEKNGKRDAISNEKLVKSIFTNRMEKGNLDQCGLSREQLAYLEELFIGNI